MEFDFCAEWLKHLLKGLESNCGQDCLFENCANFHYQVNQMESALEPFVGDLEGFISFLTETYDWKITCSDDGKTIYADENKDFCVCPVAEKLKGDVPPLLCNCSALYAKKCSQKYARKKCRQK